VFATPTLSLRPRWCPVLPSGIKDDSGRPAPHPIELQPKSVYGNELAGLRIKDVARRAAAAATCWPELPEIMIAEMTTANRKPVRDCLIVGSSRSWTTRTGFIPRCASAHIAIVSGDQLRDERLGWVTQTAVCKTCDSEEGYSPL
jgi:hypothetical protein